MTDTDFRTIRLDEFLPHPPATVWRALTEPDLLARWLMPNDFRPVIGHRFTFRTDPIPAVDFDGVAHCQVLTVEPERLLVISWRGAGERASLWTVSWRLEAEGRGTRLFFEHDGFDQDNRADRYGRRMMGDGWARQFRSIDRVLTDLP